VLGDRDRVDVGSKVMNKGGEVGQEGGGYFGLLLG